MDVRTLLGGISYNKALAREMGDQIEALYASLLPRGFRYDKDNVQSSGNDHTADTLDRIEDKRRQRQQLIDQADQDEAVALKIIGGVQQIDSREALILTMYYLRDGRDSFEEIGHELNYSGEWIRRIYHDAIRHAQEVYDGMQNSDG